MKRIRARKSKARVRSVITQPRLVEETTVHGTFIRFMYVSSNMQGQIYETEAAPVIFETVEGAVEYAHDLMAALEAPVLTYKKTHHHEH